MNNILSLQNITQEYTFHQETSLDVGALALQLSVAVGVGALTAGVGSAFVAASFGTMVASGATAAAIAVGVGHGVSLASNSYENTFAGFESGYNEGTLITTTQNVNSILNFTGNLSIEAGGNTNIEQSTISSLNINQEGLDTTIVTTVNYEHNNIKPDYAAIATGAAITGFIAGSMVVLN